MPFTESVNTMSKDPFVRRAAMLLLFAATLSGAHNSLGVAILSGPSFTKATNAPLAGVLTLTTDVSSRVSVSVNDGTQTWERSFYDYGLTHSTPLLGFKPNRTNKITVLVYDRYRNAATAAPLTFITSPLPADFPKMTLLESKPEKMEPGYTLCRIINAAFGTDYLTIIDNQGNVVWYSGNSSNAVSIDVRQLDNGDLFFPRQTNFFEINLLGDTMKTWAAPAGLPIDFHDGVPTSHGTILYLNTTSTTVPSFPTSSTDSNAAPLTARVETDRVIEISAINSSLLNTWPLINMLQPTRIDYNTFKLKTVNGWDAEHANAVIEDPSDDSLIVSLRNQDAIIKFCRGTGELKWILGPHDNWGPEFQSYLLTPLGSPFQWNYAQHAPMLTPQGTLLLYDDGNFRASPFDTWVPDAANYSRAVEYLIDEENMVVTQVWDYGSSIPERLYTGAVGDANWLPRTGNILITFGSIAYVNGVHPSLFATNATMARIKEVTHDPVPEVVFDLAVFDYANTSPAYRGSWVYRSNRILDLYAHPALPVTDLTLTFQDGGTHLEFSADATHTYLIEASTDLTHWQETGQAVLDANGDFEFSAYSSGQTSALFYRVVTE